MRIIQLVNNLDMGGLERLAVDLANLQVQGGHYAGIYCLTHAGQLAAEAESLGITVRSFQKQAGADFSIFRKMAAQLKRDRADVLHMHNHLVHHYGTVAAKMAGVPVIVNTRHRAEFQFTISPEGSTISPDSRDRKSDIIFRAALPWVDSVVLISEATRRFFVDHRGIPEKKTRVILNGAHLEKFLKVPAQPGSVLPQVRFGVAARLVPEKDHYTLFRAFAQVAQEIPEASLHVVGDGPLRESLVKMSENLKLGTSVVFHGALSNIAQFFSELDIFVLGSLNEGLPLAVLEAMAAGLPVVATRAGGVEEAAIDGDNAYLANVCDADGLAKAMIRMARSPAMGEMGARGREIVRNKFRIEQTWQEYYKLFVSLGAPA